MAGERGALKAAEPALLAAIDAALAEAAFVRSAGFVPTATLAPPGTRRKGYFPRGVFTAPGS